jgi:hypothetical protein
MIYIYATLAGIVAFAVRLWGQGMDISYPPDAVTYQHMGKGGAACNPFRHRWMIPRLLGDNRKLWLIAYPVALILTAPLLCWFGELNGINGLWAVALWVALPLWDILTRNSGIIDPFAWLSALLAACLSLAGYHLVAVLAACLAAMIDPRAMIFAALWALDPLLLVGLVPVAICEWKAPHGQPLMHADVINHPWLSSMQKNGQYVHDAPNMLLPWGACLVGLMALPLIHVVTLCIAYGQMFRAIDLSRLYMWAAPVVIVATVQFIPDAWMPVAVLATWFNPCRPVV